MNSVNNSENDNSVNNSVNVNSLNNSENVKFINYTDHFNKFRPLSVGELYYFLHTYFRDYIDYSSFVVYIKSHGSLHVPRCTFSRKSNNMVHHLRILPIFIIDEYSSHYNILIVDNIRNIAERFEPSDSSYDKDLNKLLKMAFRDNKYRYIHANHNGPQFMEIHEVGATMNCGFWVLLYVQDRLNDISCKQKQFLLKWMDHIKQNGFHNWISEYKRCVLAICSKNTFSENYICDRIYNRRPLDYYDYKLNNIVI
jgi:glutaredoxin-related protein